MDAKKFFEEFNRMCQSYSIGCQCCPIESGGCPKIYPETIGSDHMEYVINQVYEWSNDHPVKTRQSEFLKMFPNTVFNPVDPDVINIHPCSVEPELRVTLCKNVTCGSCKREYWLKEIE